MNDTVTLLTRRAARFVAERLHRHEDADGICFSYSPTDRTRVYNASLFGAKILARAALRTFLDPGLRASMRSQTCSKESR